MVEELGGDLDGLVEVATARGERVAEALEVALRGATRRRVGASNMLKTSSSSTGTCAWLAGIVAPPAKAFFDRPASSSTYFSPSADRGRMTMCESTGTGPILRSSLSVTFAPTLPLGSMTGAMSLTTPTRKPPERTSLPLMRLAPLETRTLSWRVGTNGRPLLAL